MYWKTNIATLPYAFTTIAGGHLLSTDQKLLEVPFCSDPGFRVGVDYAFGCDQWDVALLYTRFQQSASAAAARTAILNLKTVWDITGLVQADTAQATSCSRLQMVDFIIGKTYGMCDPFNLRCYTGVRWARIEESMALKYDGSTAAGEELTSQVEVPILLRNFSKNIGLIGGANANWNVQNGFCLYSRAEIALLRSNFIVSQNETIIGPNFTPPTTINLDNSQLFQSIKTNLVLELGVQWGTVFYHDCIALTLNAGYEFNYWPTHILLARFIPLGDPTAAVGPIFIANQGSDLSFRGFNFGISLQF